MPAPETGIVTFIQPKGLQQVVKDLAQERSAAQSPGSKRIFARHIYEEALSRLMNRIRSGERTAIRAAVNTGVKRSIWIDLKVRDDAQRTARLLRVSYTAFLLTAILDYLEEEGIQVNVYS